MFALFRSRIAIGFLLMSIVVNQAARFGVLDAIAPPLLIKILGSGISTAICLGVLAAFLLDWRESYTWLHRVFGHRWSVCWVAAGIILLLASAIQIEPGDRPRLLAGVAFTVLTIACVIREDHSLHRILRNAALCRIGVISYGMYLTHSLVINVVEKGLLRAGGGHPLILFALACLATILVAWVSFVTFERFFLRLKTRFATTGQVPARPLR